MHRFYLGKPISGLIWFFTWGLFGMGQIFDLLLIPGMVEEKNFEYRARLGEAQYPQLPSSAIALSQYSARLF
ncbi:MAG: NINE protein [Pleurocapsa sp. MO_226.B13]|nr:NINE protein [Pleurocapsa sp. MO_226.B13]